MGVIIHHIADRFLESPRPLEKILHQKKPCPKSKVVKSINKQYYLCLMIIITSSYKQFSFKYTVCLYFVVYDAREYKL